MSADPIRHEYVVRTTPQRAFRAYAERIGDWWPAVYSADPSTFAAVCIEPHVGGAVIETHESGEAYQWGEVTAWEPGVRLSYTSTLAQTAGSGPSEITVTFASAEGGCRVMFEHGGWDDSNHSDRRKFGDWPVILKGYVAIAEAAPAAPESAGGDGR